MSEAPPPPPERDSVLDALGQLEDLLGSSRRIPLSASVVVNEDEALELVDRVRLGLPDELVQARHLLRDRESLLRSAQEDAERILAQADSEAQRIRRDAEEHAAHAVADHEVLTQARAHGEAILAEAEERAAQVRGEADAYARDVMGRLEEQLGRALATVRKGMEALPGPNPKRSRRRPRDRG